VCVCESFSVAAAAIVVVGEEERDEKFIDPD